MDMFTTDEQNEILTNVKARLAKREGILTGACVLQNDGGRWSHYVGQFASEAELKSLLLTHFKNVFMYPKVNLSDAVCLFMASDGDLPVYNGDRVRQ